MIKHSMFHTTSDSTVATIAALHKAGKGPSLIAKLMGIVEYHSRSLQAAVKKQFEEGLLKGSSVEEHRPDFHHSNHSGSTERFTSDSPPIVLIRLFLFHLWNWRSLVHHISPRRGGFLHQNDAKKFGSTRRRFVVCKNAPKNGKQKRLQAKGLTMKNKLKPESGCKET
ncbi:hypothetical protein EV1_026016 [Malus domestica]